MTSARQRFAVVGAGARAEMFVRALVVDHADRAELVAFADTNPLRIRAHNQWLGQWDHPPVPAYAAGDFAAMLAKEQVNVVIVTSVDATHERYIVGALEAGRDVITEKPMTVDAPSCTRILHAAQRAHRRGAGSVAVAFNYRYNPVHERVREILAGAEIGEIGSVHFEWLLDVRHGADYFRRWHRDRANSGGLLVHKASHHFDLVNWWLGARPVRVYAQNRLFFYGPRAGAAHGYDRGYARAHGSDAARDDPFAIDLAGHPRLRELYLDAEGQDGYHRDQNVFAGGVTIDDDMSVLVTYDGGATMTYHLTAYSPWEGYRLMVNGSRGRLELEVVENDFVDPALAQGTKGDAEEAAATATASLHGVAAAREAGHVRLTVHPYWAPARPVDLPDLTREGHGGADARMVADLVAGRSGAVDPLGRRADQRDGARALLTGLAANASAERGQPVDVADLIDPSLLRD